MTFIQPGDASQIQAGLDDQRAGPEGFMFVNFSHLDGQGNLAGGIDQQQQFPSDQNFSLCRNLRTKPKEYIACLHALCQHHQMKLERRASVWKTYNPAGDIDSHGTRQQVVQPASIGQ